MVNARLCLAQCRRAIQPSGPYFIGGRCLGGNVAYEMALQLLDSGEDVALLALLDPALPPGMRRGIRYYVRRVGYFRRRKQLMRAVRRVIRRAAVRQVHRLRILRCFGSRHTRRIESEVGKRSVFHRTFRAHAHAGTTYAPRVYAGAITFFAPREDYSPGGPRPLWKNLTSGGFELHLVPGTHLTMSQPPHLHTLVRELESVIHKARTRKTSSMEHQS